MPRTTRFARVMPVALLMSALVFGSLWHSVDALAQSSGGGRTSSSQAVQGSSGTSSTSKGTTQSTQSGFDPQRYIDDGWSVLGPVTIRSVDGESIIIHQYKNDLVIDLKVNKVTVVDYANNSSISVSGLAPQRQVYVCRRENEVVVVSLPEARKGVVER
jgi:hypothetical protein